MRKRALGRLALATSVVFAVGFATTTPADALPPPGADAPDEPAEPADPEPEPTVDDEPTSAPSPTPSPTFKAQPQTGVTAPPQVAVDDRFADAPNATIRKIAESINFRSYSVSTLVTLPAGLNVGATEISVRYFYGTGSQWATQGYVNGTGNRFLYNYPQGDGTRRNNNTLGVHIRNGGISYYHEWLMPIEPLYDVTYSSLHYQELGQCDSGSPGDPVIAFKNPALLGNISVTPDTDDQTLSVDIPEFAGTVRGISSSGGDAVHDLGWQEDDDWDIQAPGWDFDPLTNTTPGPPLFPMDPSRPRRISTELEENGHDCSARFTYTITYDLQTHYFL